MSQTLSFPSDAFPSYPQLSLAVPSDWQALAAVGLPLAVAKEVPAGQFRPNVLVTLARFGGDYNFSAARKALDLKLKKLPRYRETDRTEAPFLGGEGLHITGRFAAAKGELIRQSVSIAVINRGHVFDVVEITATSTHVSGDNVEGEIQEIINSLSISLP